MEKMIKIYYWLDLYQEAPLRIGNETSEETDSDLMHDGRNLPFIPGSSLAGVLRSKLPKKEGDLLFGLLKEDERKESKVLISDAVLPKWFAESDVQIVVRDGVRISEWGTAVSGSKFNFQTVELKKDAAFRSVIEWNGTVDQRKNEIDNILEPLLYDLSVHGMTIGARTTRGYGRMQVGIRKKEFYFPEDLNAWLDFNEHDELTEPFQSINVSAEHQRRSADLKEIKIEFDIKDGFTVRVPTSGIIDFETGNEMNSMVLKNEKRMPVIPGTSWAGCFRHHCEELIWDSFGEKSPELIKEMNQTVFGMDIDLNKNHRRSAISFSESVIEGGVSCKITRTAVERFTASPKNTALFTEEIWYGGSGNLQIHLEMEKIPKLYRRIVGLAILDLYHGLLAFGGEAGVGRGLISIKRLMVDDKDQTDLLKQNDTGFLEV